MKRGKKKRAPVLDPLGAESTNAGSGRVAGIDFARAGWMMSRAQRIWAGVGGGVAWTAAVRQAQAEWCLVRFLTGGWR